MDEDIYIVDARNADHRTPQSGTIMPGRVGTGVRTVVAQPARVYGPSYGQSQPQIIYAGGSPTTASALLGRVTPGVLVDLVAQIFAALMPLPGAPVATTDAATDIQNMMTYQTALAQYAKRDEQVRTLGNLVTKLLG